MKTLTVEILIDVKAAAMRGNVLERRERVELAPSDYGDKWAAVAAYLSYDCKTLGLGAFGASSIIFQGVETADIIAGVDAANAWHAAREAKRAAEIASNRASIAAYAEKEPVPCRLHADRNGSLSAIASDFRFEIDAFKVPDGLPYIPFGDPLRAERAAAEKTMRERVEAANAAAVDAARKEIDAFFSARDAANEEYRRAEREEAERANAERLRSGKWTRETPTYNQRRYGPWWCAKVVFPDGPKPIYEFGESSGKHGDAGTMELACAPGEIIAYGQKDHRGSGSTHVLQTMEADGSMRTVDRSEAYARYKAGQ